MQYVYFVWDCLFCLCVIERLNQYEKMTCVEKREK